MNAILPALLLLSGCATTPLAVQCAQLPQPSARVVCSPVPVCFFFCSTTVVVSEGKAPETVNASPTKTRENKRSIFPRD